MRESVQDKKSKYCYDDGVLINKFDIHDSDLLDKVTRDITAYRISQLSCRNDIVNDFFKVEAFLNIHGFLFSDIFFFAGEIRDETIYKSNAPYFTDENNKTCIFAEPAYILDNLKNYLDKMKRDIRGVKTRDDFLKYLAYYYGEINFIHPFRDGNICLGQ